MIPPVIMHVLATMALLTGMTLAPILPEPDPWEPDPADVTALAKTLYGECRGCSELQQRAVAWTIFNRVDSDLFPDTVLEVIKQPSQFFGYRESFLVTDELYALAYDCLTDWHNGEDRVLEPEFLYFTGNGRINIFRTGYNSGEVWAEE